MDRVDCSRQVGKPSEIFRESWVLVGPTRVYLGFLCFL